MNIMATQQNICYDQLRFAVGSRWIEIYPQVDIDGYILESDSFIITDIWW